MIPIPTVSRGFPGLVAVGGSTHDKEVIPVRQDLVPKVFDCRGVWAGVSNSDLFFSNFGVLIFLSVSYLFGFFLNLYSPGSIFIENFTVTKRLYIFFSKTEAQPRQAGESKGGLTSAQNAQLNNPEGVEVGESCAFCLQT